MKGQELLSLLVSPALFPLTESLNSSHQRSNITYFAVVSLLPSMNLAPRVSVVSEFPTNGRTFEIIFSDTDNPF